MYSYRSNPPKTHDRKAATPSRGVTAFLAEAIVDDPYGAEPGAKITVVRSIRSDPLADRHARGFIDDCQLQAGRKFQRLFQIAEKGPRSLALADRVDTSPTTDGLTDAQLNRSCSLAKA
jgi:hypothetical protein